MGLPENIDALLVKHDITAETLARIAQVSPSSVSRWRKEGAQMRREPLERITEFFGLEDDDLLSERYGLAAKEHGHFSDLPPGAVIPAPSKPAYAPLLGRVHAGDAQAPEISDEMVSLPHEVRENHPEAYFLKVEGSCMSRVYPEGSVILIDPTHEPQNDSIAVVSIDGADYVMRKLFRTQHTMVLSPDSWEGDFEDIVITSDDERTVEFVGTVVWFQAAEELI